MPEVATIGRQCCRSFEEADALCNNLEAQGFTYVASLYNVPKPGMYEVSWGHYVEPTEGGLAYEIRTLARIYREREEEAEAAFNRECEAEGRCNAARTLAEAAGFTGRDAVIFSAGFCGSKAKFIDPRSEGREAVFRAGRRAWGSSEGQRTYRMEAVRARSRLQKTPPRPFSPGLGLIANGES